MTGYAMGRTSWMWYMPFHPAFYYSAPPYVVRPDGVAEYYPPTFSFAKLFFTILIVGAIVFVIVTVIRNRRRAQMGYGGGGSQSSFS